MSRSNSSSSNRHRRSRSPPPRSPERLREPQNSHDNRPRMEDEANSCLYIGNVNRRCREDEFKELCADFGPTEYCYIVYEPISNYDRMNDTKTSRGYGFVKYNNPQDAIRAKEQLDGRDFQGRRLNVQVSKRNKPRQSTPGEYLGRKRSSPPRRSHRRRSYSRSSSEDYRRRRKHDRSHRHSREYGREYGRDRDYGRQRQRPRERHYRSRSPQHRRRRYSQSRSPPRR